MRYKTVAAIVLIALGVVAFAYQGITYTTREKVVDFGPMHMMADKTNHIPLPPIAGAILFLSGLALLFVDTKRIKQAAGLLAGTLLVAGLTACGPQPAAAPGTDARQTTPAPAASRAPAAVRVTVPQGTAVPMTLSTGIGSATSQVGDTVIATTTSPVVVGDRVAIPTGSTIHGRVTAVNPATKGLKISEKGGAVALSFDKVTTPLGFSTAMVASLISNAKSGGKTAGIIGGSAAGGALLGKILGDNDKDVALGAVLGAGIGTGIAAGTKGKELVIPAGTDLALILDQSLTITDRS